MAKQVETPKTNLKHRVIAKYVEIKGHVERNKKIYYPVALIGIVVITALVTKRVTMMRYMRIEGTSVFIHKAALKDHSAFYKVFNIYSSGFKHKGPSWIVRCDQTGRSFRSVNYAADAMGISRGMLTSHLSGKAANVDGYTFVKIGIAV